MSDFLSYEGTPPPGVVYGDLMRHPRTRQLVRYVGPVMPPERPTKAGDIRHPWPLRLWWFVEPAVAVIVAALALLAGAALILLAAFSG